MKRINKEKIFRIWSLILLWRGKSKYKKNYPILEICGESDPPQFKSETLVAEYDYSSNVVKIWWKPHHHMGEITSTLLHEYTHYLQFWPWYLRYQNSLGYSENPYEIQALESEKDKNFFLEGVTENNWKALLDKYPGLEKIYNKVSDSGYTVS